jgi:hypothetical protein
MPSKSFKDLIVWQKAHQWVLDIYHLTDSFPSGEQFGLISQLRRAAISIPANINVAQGSIEEGRYHLILARDLGYGDTRTLEKNLEEVSRLLEAYTRRVARS